MSNSNVPDWYLTVDEFARLVADTVYECGYFKREDRMHPEDIEGAFASTATALSRGISFAGVKSGRKVSYNFVDTKSTNVQNNVTYTPNTV